MTRRCQCSVCARVRRDLSPGLDLLWASTTALRDLALLYPAARRRVRL